MVGLEQVEELDAGLGCPILGDWWSVFHFTKKEIMVLRNNANTGTHCRLSRGDKAGFRLRMVSISAVQRSTVWLPKA